MGRAPLNVVVSAAAISGAIEIFFARWGCEGMHASRRFFPVGFSVVLFVVVAACGPVPSEVFDEQFWEKTGANVDPVTDAGLASLVKGDLESADRLFGAALASNPSNAYALVGAAIVAEKVGNTRRARQFYAAIANLQPPPMARFGIPGEEVSGPIADIARYKLSPSVDSSATASAFGRSGGIEQKTPTDASRAGDGLLPQDRNILARFAILDRLLKESLITPNEHAARRSANLGALLPLTGTPPAVGLDRPVPKADDVIGRVRAIGRAMAMGAIDPIQHAHERELILNALLPVQGQGVASITEPPRNKAEAAADIARLDAFKAAELIATDEYSGERQAIENAVESQSAEEPGASTVSRVDGQDVELAHAGKSPMPRASGPDTAHDATHGDGDPRRTKEAQPKKNSVGQGVHAVHLASYRLPEQASRGWAQLVRTYRGELGDLRPEISKVDLGSSKGLFYRLTAGPLVTESAAVALCAELQSHHQYCKAIKL